VNPIAQAPIADKVEVVKLNYIREHRSAKRSNRQMVGDPHAGFTNTAGRLGGSTWRRRNSATEFGRMWKS